MQIIEKQKTPFQIIKKSLNSKDYLQPTLF